ncbi:MAG: (d)CMP kinase [Dialister sp.]|nr:(d)CMP kinase [Dialister sp.]
MKKIAIAIDGPAGAGKSSVSKIIANRLGYAYLDTGAMYRAVTYIVLIENISGDEAIAKRAAAMDMEVRPEDGVMHVVVDGNDVTAHIRSGEVSSAVSAVSAIAGVRSAMIAIQRRQAEKGGIVLDGRDIGTTVLPNADVKIFLTASIHTRAVRRFAELKEKEPSLTLDKVEADIEKRDYADSHREVSPLQQADDAHRVDNSHMTLNETAEEIIRICHEVCG